MKSLQRRFNNVRDKKKNLYLSDYLCFVLTVIGQNFSRPTISRWFNKLVDKDDYALSERKKIVDHLLFITKTP